MIQIWHQMPKSYKERLNLACNEGLKPGGDFLSSLQKYNLKLFPGEYIPRMPQEYCMAPIPHSSTPNTWIYPSMIVDKDFE